MATGRGQPGRPTHHAVYDDLRDQLESGALPVGTILPTENELQARYGVTRYGLREALGMLEREGYIERRRRAGTRVLARAPQKLFRHAASSQVELHDFVHHTAVAFGPPELIETDGRLARQLGCDEMRRWHHMEGIRVDQADGRPIGIVQLYIDAARATIDAAPNFGPRPVYEWLEENYGIRAGAISQDISAVLLTEAQAKLFGEREGGPALRIARRYFDDQQRIFQITVTTHRSENFIYNLRLQLG